MDGPTIQAAAQQALDRGVRTADVLRTVEAVAATGTPTVVMTYWNPVERYGVERFARDLAAAGGAGLITPDLTPDADPHWPAAADAHGLDKIFLVAPSSTDARIAMTVAACRGFVYATAVMGVTGARTTTSDLAGPLVARTKAAVSTTGRPARRRRPRRQQRRPGRRGRVVRRRRDRRLGVRPGAARPPRRPRRRAARAHRAHRGPGRREYGVRRAAVALSPRSRSSPALAGCGGDDVDGGRPARQRPRPAVHGVPGRAGRHRRRAVLAGRRHRQAAHPGLLRLHQLPRHLRHRDGQPRLGDDPARRRATATRSTWCS